MTRRDFEIALHVEAERAKCLYQGKKVSKKEAWENYVRSWTYDMLIDYIDKHPNMYIGTVLECFSKLMEGWQITSSHEDVKAAFSYAQDITNWLIDMYRLY